MFTVYGRDRAVDIAASGGESRATDAVDVAKGSKVDGGADDCSVWGR